MSIDLESLGFTREELQERVIDRLCAEFLHSKTFDPDWLAGQVNKKVQESIKASVDALAEKHLLPDIQAYVESLVLEETNWKGEQTRIAHMINQHLYHSIELAVKDALKNANSVLVKGIEDTVRIKLAEVANSLKIGVSTK